ncbi:hypothetical protein CRYUN_Cryun25bG0064600 [Craigia yunnanensis]
MALKTSFVPQVDVVLQWIDYINYRYVLKDQESFAFWPSVCKGSSGGIHGECKTYHQEVAGGLIEGTQGERD